MIGKKKRKIKSINRASNKIEEKEISEEKIGQLATKLLQILEKEKQENLLDKTKKTTKKVLEYPGAKEVLALLGAGSILVLAIAMPGALRVVKEILDKKSSQEWKRYNRWYLARTLRRLRKQKIVNFEFDGEKTVVKLTSLGRKKILKYSLEHLEIKRPRFWDRKWRLVIYDVPNSKRRAGDKLNRILSRLGMDRLQKSVFLCPFPCEDEVKFLREYLEIGDNVWLLTVSNFENDGAFKEYFGI